LDKGDPRIREILGASGEEVPPPAGRVVPARTQSGRPSATFGEREIEVDSLIEPSRQCIAGSAAGCENGTTAISGDFSQAFPETRTIAIGKPARIAIKAKGRILFIDVADLIAVEAQGNHVLLLRPSSSHILREPISTIEKKLDPYGFVRIHRSVLVNAAMVEEIYPRATGEWVLRVRGGREFTVTRTYKKNLQLLAQLWIGMEGN
jgi:DNA-binding LytR/AlgR family response regulator